LVLAWNDLHEHLGFLFSSIMADEPHDRTMHVWYSTNQDRAAREMLRAAVQSPNTGIDEEFPRAVEDITWLLVQNRG
jgi:hypothetical protein